jgi:surface antigen
MKLLLVAFVLLVTFPTIVGSTAAAIATAPHPAPTNRLFTWVPEGGYRDAFPYGQCTWWAAYNRRVTWNGNAADWLPNAQAHGVATSSIPSVGAIAVYARGGTYDPRFGHVAVVIAVGPGTYMVSEMNFIGWGRVSTRVIGWPDPQVEGFIPLRQEDQS